MRNMVLTMTIAAALGVGGCGGSDEDSTSQIAGAEDEASNVAFSAAETAPARDDDAGQAPQTLPSTATPLPLIATGGILSLGAAALVRRRREVR